MTTTTTTSPLKRELEEGENEAVTKKQHTSRSSAEIIKELSQLIKNEKGKGQPFVAGRIKGVPMISVAAAPSFNSTHFWSEAEFEKLLSVAETAPYGKDDKTIVDTSVRNCKQLNADQFVITNNTKFHKAVQDAANSAIRNNLTPTLPRIEIQLYKLLLYGQGSFFKTHQDTPRGERHFGSLVVVPPCKHKGGDLRVKHGKEERVFNFSGSAKTRCEFVAFFNDCEHEITTLTKGFRVSLVYHLFVPEGASLQPAETPAVHPIVTLIQELRDCTSPEKPLEVAYLLEHTYPSISLKPDFLKGKDLAIYNIVAQFQPRVSGIEMRCTGIGSSSSKEFFSIYDVIQSEESSVEVDELEISKNTDVQPSRLVKAIYKTYDGFQDEEDVAKAEFLITESLASKIDSMDQLAARVKGTGNCGCSYALKYMHGAIFISITAQGNTDPFTIAHSKRKQKLPEI